MTGADSAPHSALCLETGSCPVCPACLGDLVPMKWLPSEYADEIVPPPRDKPQDWIVSAPGGGYGLDREGWSDDEDAISVADGEIIHFDWVFCIGNRIWTAQEWSPPLPPEPAGANGWMTASTGTPELLSEVTHQLENNDVVNVYCWSKRSIPFRLDGGKLVAVGSA